MTIAFFDSGIGGISVLYQALKLLPNEDYLYYADTDHVPYGAKTKEAIRDYVLSAADFIMGQGDIQALVVACNTATSVAIGALRQRYAIPILGMEPAVKPAICDCIQHEAHRRVLVTATPVTLREDKLRQLLAQWDNGHLVDLLPLPELVLLAEGRCFDDGQAEAYLRQALTGYDLAQYCTVVLGCTHFNFFKDSFQRIFGPQVGVIDGSLGTVRNLERHLPQRSGGGSGQVTYYRSGRAVTEPALLADCQRLLDRLARLDD